MRTQRAVRVTAAIVRREGRILLARRAEGSHLEGLWEFPGGKVERGETPEQCLARELAEEFGLEAYVGRFITSSRHRYVEKEIELLAYEVTLAPGTMVLESHDEVRWVEIPDLLRCELAPADVPIAEVVARESRREYPEPPSS